MKYKLQVLDYIVLILIFLVTILIGSYHGLKEKITNYFSKSKISKKESTNSVSHYLTANSSMNPIPVAFSLLATFFSTTALLGIPAEVYQYGLEYWITAFSGMLTPIIGAYATGPLFARLHILTIFQYLQIRFGSPSVKYVGTLCYIVKNFISTAIFIFGPAVSLNIFSDISEKYSIIIVGSIATFYTTIGGIKGVIWTDFFQIVIMIISLLMILIKGIYDLGGFGNFFEINSNGGRFNVLDFDPNPFERQTFWSIFFGFLVYFSYSFSTDQQTLQRFQATKTKKLAQKALLLNVPGVFLMLSLCCFVGLVVYANFATCDPLTSKQITNPNQLVGFFVANNLKSIPGSAGFFLAAVFCGSLSSVSSSLNSLSSIIWEDYFKSFKYFQNLEEAKSLTTTKMIVVICGILSTLFSFIIAAFGTNLQQISTSLNGAMISPILGLFVLGCLFKNTNSWGALFGSFFGFSFGIWISFGAFIVKPYYPKLNTTIEFCSLSNDSFISLNQTVSGETLTGFAKIYSVSYMLYTPLGTFITVFIGLIVSLITGGPNHHVDDSLILLNLFGFWKKRKIESVRNTEMSNLEQHNVKTVTFD
ncbi:sodium-coupled monocarboxylate transporter 2 [Brachionus plicatilis]|uniref:Sodium-coupled monocarboxylate transporter 2 n=1 Tax=Brachionus plicatilis TaxID=10195 RepID=A0A3M7S7W3_BRAPC|nr:sodium-coupled monocarboxylate transporter 2 [Brachionus plicatilis]